MSRKIQMLVLACAVFLAISCLPSIAQDKPDQATQPAQATKPDQATQPAQTSDQASTAAIDPATKAKVQENLQKMATQLNLTDDQKDKIKPLLQEQFQQLKTVHDDTSLSPDQKQAKAKEIHQTYHSQIQAVLTPEQQKKFAAMKEQKKKEMQH